MKFFAIGGAAVALVLGIIVVGPMLASAHSTGGARHPAAHVASYEKPDHHHKHHHHKPPYPGKVKTDTDLFKVTSHPSSGQHVLANYRVHTHGNAKPSGTVTFYVYKDDHGHLTLVRAISQPYSGSKKATADLGSYADSGKYSFKAAFKPAPGSVYQPSASNYRSFKVS